MKMTEQNTEKNDFSGHSYSFEKCETIRNPFSEKKRKWLFTPSTFAKVSKEGKKAAEKDQSIEND